MHFTDELVSVASRSSRVDSFEFSGRSSTWQNDFLAPAWKQDVQRQAEVCTDEQRFQGRAMGDCISPQCTCGARPWNGQ